MPVAGGGFDQCYNAQAVVATGSMLVVHNRRGSGAQRQAISRTDAGEDRGVARGVGRGREFAGGQRLFSAANVDACQEAGVEPVIAMGRQPHHPPLAERFAAGPVAPEEPHAGRGDGPSTEGAGRPRALRLAQADARAGVRHHQVRARIPSILPAWLEEVAQRVEPGDHGVESEANVRPRPRLTAARGLSA
jgi:hypothetical protein